MALVRPRTAIAFKNILFLTDFGQSSAGALAYSLAFARHFKARLFPAHVMDMVFTNAGGVANEAVVKEMEGQKLRKLSRLAEYNGLRFQPLISRCDFEAAVAYWVSEYAIDLIVIGTHGRKGVQRFLLGSTSEVVLQNASCPVLTIGPHVEVPRLFSLHLDRILLATELHQQSMLALEYALSLAAEKNSTVSLLHVLPEESRDYPDRTQLLRFVLEEMQKMVPAKAFTASKPEFAVDAGHPAERIVTHAVQEKADLIVMGRAQQGDFSAKGSSGVTYRVISAAPCPVLSVPDGVNG